MNESSSDIFGTMVEFFANSALDAPDYWIGERIYRSNWSGSGATPTRRPRRCATWTTRHKDGASPACWSSGIGSLNVHYSSGPNNHMFYLLAHGGTSKCNGQVVAGIGNDKAARIWYDAIANRMTASSNYHAARTAVLAAAMPSMARPRTMPPPRHSRPSTSTDCTVGTFAEEPVQENEPRFLAIRAIGVAKPRMRSSFDLRHHLLLARCASSSDSGNPMKPTAARFDQPFTLAPGAAAVFDAESLQLGFDQVALGFALSSWRAVHHRGRGHRPGLALEVFPREGRA